MSHAFRAAVEARDLEAAIELLHPDVEFRSPVVFTPYRGKELVGHILRAVAQVFDEFEYVNELEAPGYHGLVFQGRVGEKREKSGFASKGRRSRDSTSDKLTNDK